MTTLYDSVGNSLKISGKSNSYNLLETFINQFSRGGDATLNGKPSYTVEQAAEQIARAGNLAGTADDDGVVRLTYSFRTEDSNVFDDPQANMGDFVAFTNLQKAQTRLSMQSWADVANVELTEAAEGETGDLTLGGYSNAGMGTAFAFLPVEGDIYEGQAWFLNSDVNLNPGLNNYGRTTLTHEIGHQLGLKHPGDYNAGVGDPSYVDASYAQDTRAYSVMSYWGEAETGQNYMSTQSVQILLWTVDVKVPNYGSAPQLDDIAAIQSLYGANMTTRTDNTVYGFNSNAGRDFYSVSNDDSVPIFSVWDAGGVDTFDFSGFSEDQKINLNEASFSNIGGLTGNVSIASGVALENAIGGSGNDLFIGNASANILIGGSGNDVFWGGEGADTFNGGDGLDTFVFTDLVESTSTQIDRILDFTSGEDRIDLSGMPEFSTTALSLQFVDAFSSAAGQIILSFDDAVNTSSLSIDFTGDNQADFALQIIGQAVAADMVV
ncbi:serine 3-dehydrogenase [Pseudomonas aeruginosa]|uniref:serralysin family metalloprotease n=1 Tax=Pseudomonas aeruginosa TaxID=287 RepID=UPI000F899322|nr:serralysin family metalloprotease [Pseudomonas aeruginosa]RUH95625.1 serine 3-dehydrogenase [Pseudomonas aeruginosa]